MYSFTILILFILLIVLFLATIPLKAVFTFHTETDPDFHLMLSWSYPFLKGIITREEEQIRLTVYLFNKKAITKNLRRKKTNYTDNMNLLKKIKPNFMELDTSYGFRDPSVTGMVCGTLDLLSKYIDLDVLYNTPNFNTEYDYFHVRAEAKINILSTLFRSLKWNSPNLLMHTPQTNK